MISHGTAHPGLQPETSFHSELRRDLLALLDRADVGFFRFTSNPLVATAAKTLARAFGHKKQLVHVGIGGSSLGPEMLISALGIGAGKSVQFVNNIDPDMLERQMRSWVVGESFFYVVSKSGNTAETLATLSIIVQWLEKNKVDRGHFKDHIVICTDPQKGELKLFAKEHQLATLEVPPSIGGRYSVLTDVGLFPAAWAGANVDKLLHGAEAVKPLLTHSDAGQNLITTTAHWLLQRSREGQNLTVLMPYSSLLKDFSAWWVQLWAESLGKENRGLTPVMAYGATDQHSQMQLFMEGPRDKAMLFVHLKKSKHDFPLHASLKAPHAEALKGHRLGALLEAEYQGTLKAMSEAARPHLSLEINELTGESLGALILFFETLTAAMGLALKVDPFNQPGVEAAKKFAHEWLGQARN